MGPDFDADRVVTSVLELARLVLLSAVAMPSKTKTRPTAKKPTAKRPTAKKPTANKPTAKKPTANKPTAKPAKAAGAAVKPELFVTGDRETLIDNFEFLGLDPYLPIQKVDPPTADFKLAADVQTVLEGVVLTSDIDCPYNGCVLRGPDLSRNLFEAIGIAKSAKQNIGGWTYPKVEVLALGTGKGKYSPLGFITHLDADSLATIDSYVIPEDQAKLARALDELARLGPLYGVRLCGDQGSGAVDLTLAERERGTYVGVLALRIET